MEKKLHRSHSNFTIKRLHQTGNYGKIFERDYMTISGMDGFAPGQIPVYSSPTFKMTVRSGSDGTKKHDFGNFLKNGDAEFWTLDNLPEVRPASPESIRKRSGSRMTDFACYGSSTELVKASIEDIVKRFPGEIVFTDERISIEKWDGGTVSGYKVNNPFDIDIVTAVKPDGTDISSLRYFSERFSEYCFNGDQSMRLTGWDVDHGSVGCLRNGDLLASATVSCTEKTAYIKVYYFEDSLIYVHDNVSDAGTSIRPCGEAIKEFFDSLDRFQSKILDRNTGYSAVLETIKDTERGLVSIDERYTWPMDGEWNIAISGRRFSEYISSMISMAGMYDRLLTDNILQSMTHEAISNMDLTMERNGEDISVPNSSKIISAMRVWGRLFDDIKDGVDGIKGTSSVEYGKSSASDAILPEKLSLSGWESKTLFEGVGDDTLTGPLYETDRCGYGKDDADTEFMKRLKLNARYLMSTKGTKMGIEAVLSMLGYRSEDYIKALEKTEPEAAKALKDTKRVYNMEEYVYVAEGMADGAASDATAEEIIEVNSLKDGFVSEDGAEAEEPLMKLPLSTISIQGADGNEKRFIVPWFDKDIEYDGGTYFHGRGGWINKTVSGIYQVNRKSDLYSLDYSAVDPYAFYYVKEDRAYYKVADMDLYNTEEGWLHEKDLDNIEGEYDETDMLREAKGAVDITYGNNPHSGDYDGGLEYEESYIKFFSKSEFTEKDLTARQNDIVRFAGFKLTEMVDNVKCHYFPYSESVKRPVEGYESDPVSNGLRSTDPMSADRRMIRPYNLTDGTSGTFDEISAASVMNSKKIKITFNEGDTDFITKTVYFYLTQMIPSTAILRDDYSSLVMKRLKKTVPHKAVENIYKKDGTEKSVRNLYYA